MKKTMFIIGGIKSGKSKFVYSLMRKYKKVLFIATAEPKDSEMKKRILLHQQERPKNFITIEEPKKLLETIIKIKKGSNIVIDCINLWLNNVLNKYSEKQILNYIENLCKELKKYNSILISNEVGCSLVCPNKVGRLFQDLLGKINQIIAKHSDEVYFMFCGIPVEIKNQKLKCKI